MHAFGQPVYKDLPYRQGYSIKYEILRVKDPAALRLQKVACDRNGVVQVYSSEGLLRPSGVALLYPGEWTPDRSSRPILDKKIKGIGLYENQFVYVDDKAVLSNSWAGKFYSPHTIPSVKLFVGGPAFSFLLSDGHALQYLKDSQIVWNGVAADSIIDIRFDRRKNSFWILGKKSISVLALADKQLRVIYQGNNLTCFEPVQDHESILVGTHDGYFVLNAASGAALGDTYRKLPCTDLSVIRRIDGRTWFGSAQGAFVLPEDGKFHYYASRRGCRPAAHRWTLWNGCIPSTPSKDSIPGLSKEEGMHRPIRRYGSTRPIPNGTGSPRPAATKPSVTSSSSAPSPSW